METERAGAGWLAFRAALALGLTAGFYAFALGLAFGLLYAAGSMLTSREGFRVNVVLFCAVSAGAILWGVLPRWDRFVPPGPRLSQATHPRLFAELSLAEIAEQTGRPLGTVKPHLHRRLARLRDAIGQDVTA